MVKLERMGDPLPNQRLTLNLTTPLVTVAHDHTYICGNREWNYDRHLSRVSYVLYKFCMFMIAILIVANLPVPQGYSRVNMADSPEKAHHT